MDTVEESRHSIISQWVHEYGDGLYSWAIHKVSDVVVAQDLVQETFISAFEHHRDFNRNSSPKTWLFSILKNKIVDHYRRKAKTGFTSDRATTEMESDSWFDEDYRWREKYRPQPWELDENLLDNPEFEYVLNDCIGKLPTTWSACVEMKYLSEKDSLGICQELHITASNLWQILHRAKLQLRQCLESNWFKV